MIIIIVNTVITKDYRRKRKQKQIFYDVVMQTNQPRREIDTGMHLALALSSIIQN